MRISNICSDNSRELALSQGWGNEEEMCRMKFTLLSKNTA